MPTHLYSDVCTLAVCVCVGENSFIQAYKLMAPLFIGWLLFCVLNICVNIIFIYTHETIDFICKNVWYI